MGLHWQGNGTLAKLHPRTSSEAALKKNILIPDWSWPDTACHCFSRWGDWPHSLGGGCALWTALLSAVPALSDVPALMNGENQIVSFIAFVLICLKIIEVLLWTLSTPSLAEEASLHAHQTGPLLWYPVNSCQTKPGVSHRPLLNFLFFHLHWALIAFRTSAYCLEFKKVNDRNLCQWLPWNVLIVHVLVISQSEASSFFLSLERPYLEMANKNHYTPTACGSVALRALEAQAWTTREEHRTGKQPGDQKLPSAQ